MNPIKHTLALALISFAFCASGVYGQDSEPVRLKPGDKAPKVVTCDIYGKIFNSEKFQGEKMLLISFFGTYCKPCIAEFSELKQLYRQYRNKLVIVLVNEGMDSRQILKEFRMNHDIIDFIMLRDRFKHIAEPFGVNSVPVTILVGLDGRVIHAHYGAFNECELYATLSPIIQVNIDNEQVH